MKALYRKANNPLINGIILKTVKPMKQLIMKILNDDNELFIIKIISSKFLNSFLIKNKKNKKMRTARLEHATYRFGVCCSAD